MKDRTRKIIVAVLLVIAVCCAGYLIWYYATAAKTKQSYDDAKKLVTENVKPSKTDSDDGEQTKPEIPVDFTALQEKNPDIYAWIKIDGTNINYPVMQNGDFYLHRNVYKNYSSSGTPYLAEHCNLKTSDNLIIYGHHMKNSTMFSNLDNYKNYNYYKNHKYIKFYTLEDNKTIENDYEIVFAFKTVAYSDKGFKYYNYTKFYDENDFNSFVEKCRNYEFYNTNVKVNYGDKLITLSTCEYSQKNGRMVIIAKKI